MASNLNNLKIIPIIDATNIKKIEVTDDDFLKKISNGVKIKNTYGTKMVMFAKDNKPISIYREDGNLMKSYRVFNL